MILRPGAGEGFAPVPASGFSVMQGYAGVRGDRDGMPAMCPDPRLAALAYLYPPGRTPADRWEVRWEAARVLRRMARGAS